MIRNNVEEYMKNIRKSSHSYPSLVTIPNTLLHDTELASAKFSNYFQSIDRNDMFVWDTTNR